MESPELGSGGLFRPSTTSNPPLPLHSYLPPLGRPPRFLNLGFLPLAPILPHSNIARGNIARRMSLDRIMIHLPPSPQITSSIPKRTKHSHELPPSPSTHDDPALQLWRHSTGAESRPSPVRSTSSDSTDFSLIDEEFEKPVSWDTSSASDAWRLGGGPATGATTPPPDTPEGLKLAGGQNSDAESYPSLLEYVNSLDTPEKTPENDINTSSVKSPNWRSPHTADLRAVVVIAIQSIWGTSRSDERATHDGTPRPLPLEKFITEILHRSQSTLATVQLALCYIHKGRHELRRRIIADTKSQMKATLPLAPPSSPDGEGESTSPVGCGRRMFLVALVLASKFLEDRTYSTRGWGKIAGMGVAEVSRSERTMLDALQYELYFSGEEFHKWLRRLALLAQTLAPTSQRTHPIYSDHRRSITAVNLPYNALQTLLSGPRASESSTSDAHADPADRRPSSSSKSLVVLPMSPPEEIELVWTDVNQRRISGLPKQRKSTPM